MQGHKWSVDYKDGIYICYDCKDEQTDEKKNTMNYSTAVLVMNQDARCVKTIYEPDTQSIKQTREMFKTFDKSLKVGDFVVVPTDTRFNLTVCQIVEVDTDDWMDVNKEIGWVVGRVDMADSDKVKAWEASAVESLKDAEKRKRRRELQASMTDAMNEKEKESLSLMLASPLSDVIEEDINTLVE